MTKIVHEHLPATVLPERLRKGINASATVTVTVQEESPRPQATLAYLRELAEAARRRAKGVTAEEAVARVRALRDEWD